MDEQGPKKPEQSTQPAEQPEKANFHLVMEDYLAKMTPEERQLQIQAANFTAEVSNIVKNFVEEGIKDFLTEFYKANSFEREQKFFKIVEEQKVRLAQKQVAFQMIVNIGHNPLCPKSAKPQHACRCHVILAMRGMQF